MCVSVCVSVRLSLCPSAVKCKPSDTIEMLRAKIAEEVGLGLVDVQLRTPYGGISQWETWAMRPEQTLKEAANGAPFPRQLLLQQPLTVFAEAFRSIVNSQITLDVDVHVSLPAAVVAPMDPTSSARRLWAEIVCECGHSRIFTGTGRGSGEISREKGDRLDEALSKFNVGIANGVIHDDEGLFHDSVEIILSGFQCYVLWTPEGLMAQLDEDLNGELSVAELNEALRMFDTKITAAMIDSDCDGVITTDEMEIFLREHPDLMSTMCKSALVEETAFELRVEWSCLPGEMLHHRHCQGFPRFRVELAVAPIDIVLDMRDMAVVNLVTNSASKGFGTIFPVDHMLEVTSPEDGVNGIKASTPPPSVDPCDTAATEFDVIIGRKSQAALGHGAVPSGALPISISVRRAGVSILQFSVQLRVDVLRHTLGVLRARGDINLFGSCENEERGCWEPWLEPWALCFSYTSAQIVLRPEEGEAPADVMMTTTDEVELSAAEVCTVDISYSLMRDLLEISALLAESTAEQQSVESHHRRWHRHVDLAHSPFIFYNDTGSPFEFFIDKSAARNGDQQSQARWIDSYDRTWLKAEDMQSVFITDMQGSGEADSIATGKHIKTGRAMRRWANIRDTLPGATKMLSAIVILDGYEIQVPEIRTTGVHDLLSIWQRDHGNDSIRLGTTEVQDLKSVVEIDPSSGHKTISLRSSVRLHNKTDVHLIAQINAEGVDRGEFPLPVGTARSVPITMTGTNMEVRVRPVSEEICMAKEQEFRQGGESSGSRGHLRRHGIEWSEYIQLDPGYRTVGDPYRDDANEDAMQITVDCPHLSNEPDLSREPESDLKFHCHAVWCQLDKAMTTGHRHTQLGTLAFIPFMTIVNELPCAARLQLLMHTKAVDDGDVEKASPSGSDRGSPTGTRSSAGRSSQKISPKHKVELRGRWQGGMSAAAFGQLTKKKTAKGGLVFKHGQESIGNERVLCELESGETFAVPCLGRWSGSVAVLMTVTDVDLLYPPITTKLRGMFEDMDVDMDGTLSAREIENNWDRIEGLDAIFQELLMHAYGVVKLPPKSDGSANVFSYTPDDTAANDDKRVMTRNGDIFVIVNSSREDEQLEGYPIGRPELIGSIPSYLVEPMSRGDEIKTFLAGTPDNWDQPLTMEQFLGRFRFPEGSANVAKDLSYHTIYHQHVCSPKNSKDFRKAQKTIPTDLLEAWKPRDEYNATPQMLPLERMKRGLGEPMSEGLLCLKFHFSLIPGIPVELHLFSSHWLVNRGLTPLVVHAGNPVDADAALSGSAVSGVIGGADIAVRSAIKGVSGIVTKPLEGLQEGGVGGFFQGIGEGLYGAVVDPVTGVIKVRQKQVVIHTI